MAGHEIKIAFPQQVFFDAAQHQGLVALAYFRYDHADGEAALGAQGAGQEIGAIVELVRRGENLVLSRFGNGVGYRRAVHHQRQGSRGKAKVIGEKLQADFLSWVPGGGCSGLFPLAHLLLAHRAVQSPTSATARQSSRISMRRIRSALDLSWTPC